MMTLSVFTNSDGLSENLLGMVLSVSPIVGGKVASFAYVILARGTYLDNIHVGVSNRQVLHCWEVEAMDEGAKSPWLSTGATAQHTPLT